MTGLVERVVLDLDAALRTLAGANRARRPYPAEGDSHPQGSTKDATHAAGLMRVNHAGEVCAQALYRGQAAVARDEKVRAALLEAAAEEQDHLAWCQRRLEELGARTSRLNPLWYASSFALGAVTGLLGDRLSLGFVAATEEKVVEHLARHEASLAGRDEASRRVVTAMKQDEARHGAAAMAGGGRALPEPVKAGMAAVARLMTTASYRL